jgi:hypothetical protein
MDGQAAPPTADFAPSMMIEKLPDLVNADAALVRRGRLLTVDILLEIGPTPYYVSIERGRIARLERGPVTMRSWSFAIRGSEHAWRQFWLAGPAAALPRPVCARQARRIPHRGRSLSADGPFALLQGRAAAARQVGPARLAHSRHGACAGRRADARARLDPIVGRYLHVTLQGRPHRLYFEEAGQGIPLVACIRGADGRQFRHMMTDAGDHRCVPRHRLRPAWHGKSTPPDGWHDEEYR